MDAKFLMNPDSVEIEYPCVACPEVFNQLEDFWVHMEGHDENKSLERKPVTKKFMCSYCGKMFQRPSDVQVHEVVHTSDKPFDCRYCDRKFNRVSNRNRHERVHLGLDMV